MNQGPILTCAECSKPVRENGYVWISMEEVQRVREEYSSWMVKHGDEFVAGVELMTLPSPAEWRVHHRACGASPDGATYWFDVERAWTWQQWLGWVAHLLEKDWVKHTNLRSFLYSIGAAD